MDNSPAEPPAGDNGLFLEPLQGWGTGRVSHSPAIMASPTAVSMELTDGSQDGPYGQDMTGMSMLSGDMHAGSTGVHSPARILVPLQPLCCRSSKPMASQWSHHLLPQRFQN